MSNTTSASEEKQDHALVVSRVRVAYKDGGETRVVLDDIDFSIDKGEIVVISGESGAGKTTLLTIAGLLKRPDSGQVRVDGIDTFGLSSGMRTKVRRDHLSFVYQSANLFPTLTASEQLELVGHIRREKKNVVRERAHTMLSLVDLEGRTNQLPHELSGGERQRVGIARALMTSPSILIADEPTASLDPERARVVAKLLSDAARDQNIATIIVAHDSASLEYADRHLRLVGGKLRQ